MFRKMIIAMTMVLALAAIIGMASAQGPEMMVYSGIIPQGVNDGDGYYDITFSLYGSQQGGAALWSETQSVYVYHGTYAVYLGAVQRLNLAFDMPYWVGVKAGGREDVWPLMAGYPVPAYSALAADTKATGAPEAVLPDEVLSANIKEADNLTGQNTNTGSGVKTGHIANLAVSAAKIANNAVTSTKIKDGSIATSDIANGAVTDPKITGPIATTKLNVGTVAGTVAAGDHGHNYDGNYVNATGDTMTGALNLPANGLNVGAGQLIATGGKVGIGTATPNASLDAANLIRVIGLPNITWPTTGSGLELAHHSTSNTGYIQSHSRDSSSWGTININAAAVNIGGSPGNLNVGAGKLVTAGGNVGIGTTTPAEKLSIAGAGSAIELGAGVAKETNAGKIAYQKFGSGALEIVGAGTLPTNRKLQFYNEGGANFIGPVSVTGSLEGNISGLMRSAYVFDNGSVSGVYVNSDGEFQLPQSISITVSRTSRLMISAVFRQSYSCPIIGSCDNSTVYTFKVNGVDGLYYDHIECATSNGRLMSVSMPNAPFDVGPGTHVITFHTRKGPYTPKLDYGTVLSYASVLALPLD